MHILRGRNDPSQKKPPPSRERPCHRLGGGICASVARALAGAAQQTALPLNGQVAPRVEPEPAVPSLDIEPRSSPKGPHDRLLPDYQYARTFASERHSEGFPLLSAHIMSQNGAF